MNKKKAGQLRQFSVILFRAANIDVEMRKRVLQKRSVRVILFIILYLFLVSCFI